MFVRDACSLWSQHCHWRQWDYRFPQQSHPHWYRHACTYGYLHTRSQIHMRSEISSVLFLNGFFTQKWKLFHRSLALMSFQIHKIFQIFFFVHQLKQKMFTLQKGVKRLSNTDALTSLAYTCQASMFIWASGLPFFSFMYVMISVSVLPHHQNLDASMDGQ